MAKLRSKMLFFTTSPRTPDKMIPEIKLLAENFTGCVWDRATQAKFTDCLAQSDFYHGEGSLQNMEFSARDRINRAPKALGFVDLSPCVKLTAAGEVFTSEKHPQDVFTRQLLKFQLPSPYHIENKDIKGTFWIKPYLEIIRLVRDLKTLSFDELMVFGMTMTNYRDYEKVKQEIIDFRNEKETFKDRGGYKKCLDSKWSEIIKERYSEDIQGGKIKTRESKVTSLKKFLDTKKRNARDYTDACFRYLRYTGLIAISSMGRRLSVVKEKADEVDYILSTVQRDPVHVDSTDDYKAYLFDASIPVLYNDDRNNLIRSIVKTSNYTEEDLSQNTDSELKDIQSAITSEVIQAIRESEEAKLKDKSALTDIRNAYVSIREKTCFDAPTLMEYNTWRAMKIIDGGYITGNYQTDDYGNPVYTALGNRPDIECEYKDFNLIVEVTLQSGKTQFQNETDSVSRHFGEYKEKHPKELFCLFIAPKISESCIAYFYGCNQINIAYYGGYARIIPLTLDQFELMVGRSAKCRREVVSSDIHALLTDIINFLPCSKDEKEWATHIDEAVRNWLKDEQTH